MLSKEEKRVQRNIKERDRLRLKRQKPQLTEDELLNLRKERNKKKRIYNRNLQRSKRNMDDSLSNFIAKLI